MDPVFVGVPKRARPRCADLLDLRTRAGLKMYQAFGHPGKLITDALAYIELLEEELSRVEAVPE